MGVFLTIPFLSLSSLHRRILILHLSHPITARAFISCLRLAVGALHLHSQLRSPTFYWTTCRPACSLSRPKIACAVRWPAWIPRPRSATTASRLPWSTDLPTYPEVPCLALEA
ncbi:hypothetical protein HYQ44_004512 [Verticillium longisporum]|nr:hypothetical protein HYQ44_004512 [Verticillium longisporum]